MGVNISSHLNVSYKMIFFVCFPVCFLFTSKVKCMENNLDYASKLGKKSCVKYNMHSTLGLLRPNKIDFLFNVNHRFYFIFVQFNFYTNKYYCLVLKFSFLSSINQRDFSFSFNWMNWKTPSNP